MDEPLDPRKSVFYQRYLRLQYATAKARESDGTDSGEAGFSGLASKLGQLSKVDRVRRGQIFTKSEASTPVSAEKLKTFKKTADATSKIRETLQRHYLFKSIKDKLDGPNAMGAVTPLQRIIDCMYPQQVEAGKPIITQGDFSDNMCFYILETGKATALVDNKPVTNFEPGSCFGELALIYNAPRAATVRATEDCTLWAIDFKTYKAIQANTEMSKVYITCEFLKKCSFLDALSNDMLTKLAGVVEEKTFEPGDYIIRQGEWYLDEEALAEGKDVFRGDPHFQTKDQEFFIIKEGKVRCTQVKASGKEVPLITLEMGSHFGEMALLTDEPRRASCIAEGFIRCLSLSRQNFKRMLGPINVVLEQRMRIRILQSVPLLQSIPEAKLLLMSQAMITESFKDGAYIIKQGDQGNAFYIIHEGQVKCTTLEGKNEVERVRLEPGEFFGERALIRNEPRKANVIAVGDVECLVLTKDQYREFMTAETGVNERVGARDYMRDDGGEMAVTPNNANLAAAVQVGDSHSWVREEVHNALSSYKFDELFLMRTVGTGTFGRVKLVRPKDSKDANVYALKCMRKKDVVEKHQDANIISEKNLLFACAESPFILKLYQTFNTPNSVYMLMEFVQGGELWSYIYDAKKSHLLPRNAVNGLLLDTVKFYASNVILAFQHMHSKNIAYRDLKPENLLISSSGYLKIIDFGFAKKIPFLSRDGKVLNKTYTLCGTPEYLAPEIVLSRGYDKSVDCWALGCLVYELFFQKTPFAEPGESNTAIFRKIVESESTMKDASRLFPLLTGTGMLNPTEHQLFSSMVLKMLSFNPSLRLGNTNGGMDVFMTEPLFGGNYPWDGIRAQKYSAPFCPIVKDKLDAGNFETYPEDDSDPPFTGDQSKFQNF